MFQVHTMQTQHKAAVRLADGIGMEPCVALRLSTFAIPQWLPRRVEQCLLIFISSFASDLFAFELELTL